MRRFKPHILSEAEERLLALGAASLAGHRETFAQLTNIDMQFGVIKDENGQEVTLSQSSYSSFLYKRDQALRRTAFHQFYKEFSDHRFTIASSLASSVKADVFRARARHYPSALEAALFSDRIPLAIYDNLIASVRSHLEPLARYYDLRKRVLKLDAIHQYDTYVPMVADLQTDTSFDEAIDLVVDSLATPRRAIHRHARRGLAPRPLVRPLRDQGQALGRVFLGQLRQPAVHPDELQGRRVLGRLHARARGRPFHAHLVRAKPPDLPGLRLPDLSGGSRLDLQRGAAHASSAREDRRSRRCAPTSSTGRWTTCAARSTGRRCSPSSKRSSTRWRRMASALTLDSFTGAYHSLLEAYFGPRFTLDPELDLECLRIPHFYNAFYVYKYATGISAAVALSQKVLAGGQADVDAYLGFLKSGGSQYPLETLQAAGVDLSTPGADQRRAGFVRPPRGRIGDAAGLRAFRRCFRSADFNSAPQSLRGCEAETRSVVRMRFMRAPGRDPG